MAQPPEAQEWKTDPGRRRSMRVLLSLPITVRGKTPDGKKIEEDSRTLVVNAHGALIALGSAVRRGQVLQITNKASHEKLDCRVVYIGPAQGGKTQIGIEFLHPSPEFWQISFPPDDWKVPED